MVTFRNSVPLDRNICADVLLCCETVVGSAILNVPAASGTTIDPATGQLVPVYTVVQAGPAQLRANVITEGQVINHGVIPVNVFAAGTTAPIYSNLELPFDDVVSCPCITSDADITKANFKIKALIVTGFLQAGVVQLNIEAVYEYCFSATKKQLLVISGTDACSCC